MNVIDLARAADELLAAYRSGHLLEDLPAGCRPVSVMQARRIQDRLFGPLRRGQIVLTGARIKPTPVERGVRVQARLNGLGTVELAT